ncbi:MAG: hypothetical protein HOV80_15575 [Polyangiaceae bacterium]|nr:hypothetical protein [Polyangiaceae bacterium]
MDRRAFLCATLAVTVTVPTIAIAQQPQSPHGGGGKPRAQGQYEPPEDIVTPSEEIPAGTIVVRILNADDKPVANTDVTLQILHQSVALGDTKELKAGTTNDDGFAQFDGLKVGTGHVYQVKAPNQGATFQSTPFGLNREGSGVAVILHVFDASANMEDTFVFTPDARVFLSLKDDVIVVQYEALIANPSPVAWIADYSILMPPEWKAFSGEDDAAPATVATDTSVNIKGTVPPGGTVIRFRFHVPHHNKSDISIPVALPPNTTRILIAAEASKQMGLTADGFPKEAERVRDRGRTLLKLEKQWTPKDGRNFFSKVNLKLTGLPTRGIFPWVAAGLAGTATVGAVSYAWTRRSKAATLTTESRADLIEAKEAMLEEIVALERAHARGEVGPRAYDRLRRAMLDALARIVERLDASPAPPDKPAPAPASSATEEKPDDLGWDSADEKAPANDTKKAAASAAAPAKKKAKKPKKRREEGEQDA